MSMRTRSPEQERLGRKRKLLERVLKKLDESVVIVEGKKDTRALRALGVKGKLVEASGKVRGICTRFDAESAVVLTDMDKAGKELADMLVGELEGCGVVPDLQPRRDLRYVLGLWTVEEMPRKLEEFREKLRLKTIENG